MVSALVLVSAVLGATVAGDWPFAILIAVLGALMCWEWAQICGGSEGVLWMMTVCGAATPLVSAAGGFTTACILAGAGAVAVLLLAWHQAGRVRNLLAIGLPYTALAGVAAIWLRHHPEDGLAVILWVVAVVIATDVGAFFVGRAIGGPRLAPSISPKKTWAGLFGGMIAAGLAGLIAAAATEAPAPVGLAIVSVGLAVVAQAGDLCESALKRLFNVKDSSALLPGHGGFLDRLDGYLTTIPVVGLMTLVSGESPLKWQ